MAEARAVAIEARTPRQLFLFAMAASLLWKLQALALPPHGEHAWRDADGLGVARAFLHESWNLLLPRAAERGSLPGIVGMEFPLVNWLAAASMALFDESDAAARAAAWLSVAPLALGGRALGRRLLGDELAAALAAACLCLQPLVLIFSRKLMPEIPMLALLVWGLYFAHVALTEPSPWRALPAGLLLALAAVIKPTGAAAGVAVAIWAARALRESTGRDRMRLALRAVCIAALPVSATAAWFMWARFLELRYGLPLFKLRHDWLEWMHLIYRPTFLAVVLGRVLHLYMLWPTVIFLAFRFRDTAAAVRAHRDVAAWALAALALIVAFGSHNYQHSYYAVGILPPLCLLAGDAVARAARALRRSSLVVEVFVLVFAVTAAVRAAPRFPPLGYDPAGVAAALPRLPQGLTVATDEATPVVSLVILHRIGWALPPEALTPARLEELRREGARVLIESAFGGWLTPETRAALSTPVYQDAQVRAYALAAPAR